RCSAALPANAQFCGSCGASIAGAAPQAPQAPPQRPVTPPPMPHAQGFSSAASGGQSTQVNFSGRVEDVFTRAVGAIGAAHGQVTWQQPPSAAKFLIGYKNF